MVNKKDIRIGVVVHGPEIVDSGYAAKIIKILQEYGDVKARLGGTMGRTAVIDAQLEKIIDISTKLLPSQSIDKFTEENVDIIFLINYGKSSITGHTFGYKVQNHCQIINSALIQIERPGEEDGSVVAWTSDSKDFAEIIAKKLDLEVISTDELMSEIKGESSFKQYDGKSYRKVAGVSPDDNIFVNGIVIGKSLSNDTTLVAMDGIIIDIKGGEIKAHGIEKLGCVDLENAVIKTGLLRKSIVKPRIVKSNYESDLKAAFLNHAAEDIYKLKDTSIVVTVGDDTTLVAADILYRFNIPLIGITDGDLDKVVAHGFKTPGSLIIEFEHGMDDYIGELIFYKLFKGKETIKIGNIENFKNKLIQTINNITKSYKIKYN